MQTLRVAIALSGAHWTSLPTSFYGCLHSRQHCNKLHGHANHGSDGQKRGWNRKAGYGTAIAVFGGAVATAWAFSSADFNKLKAEAPVLIDEELKKRFGVRKPGLPEYSLDDVAKHASVDDRVWVCFNNGVYDITDFISHHPGGDKILLGAGGSVEPFWTLYAVHKRADVLELFETYRIGNLREDDVGVSTANMTDPYALEPRRHVALKPASKTPFNGEPPLSLLVEHLITPNELFFVRNHLPVPDVKENEYTLEVSGLGVRELSLSLADIKKFPRHTITAAVQCGGNRRSEMVKVRPVKGLSWGAAAISNATWTGARLSDVLRAAGLDETNTEAKHVQVNHVNPDQACAGEPREPSPATCR
ncbi:hypothetical protein HAZT_HAZT004931 [Hyalella azteca]|uniref:sulfite oxidase n=1 Tax=Hyalella azteca TaxID=294128 RepID=A0A6A0H8F7_HYAAZ|nr:hypothetical protein HAZT_HAZT004931 [Hyalella azteca]